MFIFRYQRIRKARPLSNYELNVVNMRADSVAGYSGVGIYTRKSACSPIRAEEGLLGVLSPPNSSQSYRDLPPEQHIGGYLSDAQVDAVGLDPVTLDAEGRCVILEFPAFVLFGLYSPANSSGLRDDFRYGFLIALDTRVRNLVKMGKRVVVCGDLNVSREPLDTANAEENMRKEGVTLDDYLSTPNRRIFNQLLEDGKVVGGRDEGRERPVLWDVCRGFHPNRKGMYTHWEQKINARPGNFGSRIDFILCSLDMRSWFSESNIQEGLMVRIIPHCRLYIELTSKGLGPLSCLRSYIRKNWSRRQRNIYQRPISPPRHIQGWQTAERMRSDRKSRVLRQTHARIRQTQKHKSHVRNQTHPQNGTRG